MPKVPLHLQIDQLTETLAHRQATCAQDVKKRIISKAEAAAETVRLEAALETLKIFQRFEQPVRRCLQACLKAEGRPDVQAVLNEIKGSKIADVGCDPAQGTAPAVDLVADA